MEIQVTWVDSDPPVLRYSFPAIWSWDDFEAVKLKADAMIDSKSPQSVALVMDGTASKKLPLGIFSKGVQFIRTRHPDGKPVIIVSSQPLILNMVRLVKRLLHDGIASDIYTTETIEEAYRILDCCRDRQNS